MYRFDDKWRKRLLEDALVADLLDGVDSETSRTQRPLAGGNAPVSTRAGVPEGRSRVAKSSA